MRTGVLCLSAFIQKRGVKEAGLAPINVPNFFSEGIGSSSPGLFQLIYMILFTPGLPSFTVDIMLIPNNRSR